jgi:hypothetical protein
MEKQMKYQEIVDILKVGVHSISFYKLNGDLREMSAVTRDPDLIPVDRFSSEQNTRVAPEETPTAVAVWDVENENWRSFVVENLIAIDA